MLVLNVFHTADMFVDFTKAYEVHTVNAVLPNI